METVEYLDEDIGRIYKYRKNTGSMQYIIRIPATIGANPKFTFKHGEPVKITIQGNKLIIEKLQQ
jgi:hypothetical protein